MENEVIVFNSAGKVCAYEVGSTVVEIPNQKIEEE